ncbi:MAG: hypothetical protein NTW19_08465 [Planctomycetota bacterium]|nr:hypothetical protein [Planctomycetota bacterium]
MSTSACRFAAKVVAFGLMLVAVFAARVAMAEPQPAAPPQPPARFAPLDAEGTTFRLYEGLTLLVDNPTGKAFTFSLDLRDLNLVEPGPREVLMKVYDPEGKAVVREIIPDDGVVTPVSQLPTGGWDHEGWYYLYQTNHGAPPMFRWTGLTAPDRLAAVPVRTFVRPIPEGPKGMYRVVLVGARDHVATVKFSPALAWAVGGNPYFVHPTGDFLKKRFVYIPKGTSGLTIAMVEHDRPRTRHFTLRDPAGKVLAEGTPTSGIVFAEAKPEKAGDWDDKVFSLEVGDGPGSYMVQFTLLRNVMQEVARPMMSGVPAFYAPDEATARALHGGAIEHDGEVFWLPQQVKLHDWLKKLAPADFEVKNADGTPAAAVKILNFGSPAPGLDIRPNRNDKFIPPNGPYAAGCISDTIMFSYMMHKNRQALNVAIRDMIIGINTLGPGDHVKTIQWRGMANLAYAFGTYDWHWWRPAWRLLKESDAPADIKELLRDAFLNAGDRLGFCRNWERVNGNAFTTVLCGLRYVSEATGDPMQKELFETFCDRFMHGGWGPRVGLGPSGLVHEEFAYDFHYGSYTINTLGCVADDLQDPRFIAMREGLQRFYSYTLNDEVAPCPYSARTAGTPPLLPQKEGPYAWKGFPGPDVTESINGANEFFAARRKGYYILSYHGRMTPNWECNAFTGQIGWSGGVLCQMVVPGKGTVLASTLEYPGYGKNMHPSQWPTFRIHTLAGQTADGLPLVAADGEHLDAHLEGNTVIGSGEVRNSSVVATRSYTYNPDHVVSEVKLRITDDDAFLNFWFKSPFRGYVTEAWEMIPFVANKKDHPAASAKPEDRTSVKVLDAAGKEVGDLAEATCVGQTVVIDRGGFGVRIELEKPMTLKRGAGDTVMIQVVSPTAIGPRDPEKEKPNAELVALRYKLVPFGE